MAKKVETPEVPANESQAASQVAETNQGAVVAALGSSKEIEVVQSLDDMFAEDAGDGSQGLTADDYAIPFITVLQKGSPQCDRANPKWIKGAEQGMFFNTVTGKYYDGIDEGIRVIPCAYQRKFMRWHDRDAGGGLVGVVAADDPIVVANNRDDRGRIIIPGSSDVIIDTAYHFMLFLPPDGGPEWAILSMSSSQLKKSRILNTLIQGIQIKNEKTGKMFNPPRYSHVFRVTTVPESKDSYNWYGIKTVVDGVVPNADLYRMAREFSHQVMSNKVKVSAPPSDFEGPADTGSASGDVPF